ncbi:MAG: TonB-dependent receptor plug domain-containing protein [Muribaculaceae bacterium]|nr:TonB-dependent receptor plug domain-containing protein [Muribaculaceae bacterium]
MKKRISTLIVFAGLIVSVFGEVPFNGLLLDREMKPKKGVKVYVNDPKRYASTDKQGRFGLTDVQPDDTLTLVLSKKERIRIPVEGRRGIRIILAGNNDVTAENDDEIADTGYGYVKRREFTGVSSGISGNRLRATGCRNVLEALKGLVPGLNITGSGGSYTVNIRGTKSLNGPNEPIYVVDGVVVPALDFVSMYDVDHVEVLKDASQYGSRGANGAILVTTKTGDLRKK